MAWSGEHDGCRFHGHATVRNADAPRNGGCTCKAHAIAVSSEALLRAIVDADGDPRGHLRNAIKAAREALAG